jgi:hypothetical protein
MVLVLSALPLVTFAQGGIPEKLVPCNGVDCTVCDLAQLAQNILNGAIFLSVFLSALLFAYAGWLYLTNEAIGEQQKAKSLFKDVVIGLIIILSAWLIVNAIITTLAGTDFRPWQSVCEGGSLQT